MIRFHFWAWWRSSSKWGYASSALMMWIMMMSVMPASAVILWNDPETTLVHDNGLGSDILHGAAKRDSLANDTLYFRLHIDPLSDRDTEEYLAAFELFEGSAERLGIGNALKAWAYSAFFRGDDIGGSKEAPPY